MWQEFFYFSKAERRGVFALMLCCTILLIAPSLFPDAAREAPDDFNALEQTIAEWNTSTPPSTVSKEKAELPPVAFNPNMATARLLQQLQLPAQTIRAWLSYLKKGGRFNNLRTLSEFRALSAKDLQRIQPLLQFEARSTKATPILVAQSTTVYEPELIPSPFDPNQITEEELVGMGIPEKIASNWAKFLRSGGFFREAEDIGRIYGMDDALTSKLKPYVAFQQLPKHAEPRANTSTPIVSIDINQASIDDWQQLRGIGPVLAKRVVKFREALGGFYGIHQIKETYGLPDSTFQAIQSQLQLSAILQPIYINQIEEADFAVHPYIKRSAARAICRYRAEHGAFQQVDDLFKIYALEAEVVERIRPYLVFE